MAKPMISVFGGTGQQGGGVIDALLAWGQFSVRVATWNDFVSTLNAEFLPELRLKKRVDSELFRRFQPDFQDFPRLVFVQCNRGAGSADKPEKHRCA